MRPTAFRGCHLRGAPAQGRLRTPDLVAALVCQLGTTIGLAILEANTGTLLHTVRQAYRPDAAMRHFITIRDARCRMFGCQLRAQH